MALSRKQVRYLWAVGYFQGSRDSLKIVKSQTVTGTGRQVLRAVGKIGANLAVGEVSQTHKLQIGRLQYELKKDRNGSTYPVIGGKMVGSKDLPEGEMSIVRVKNLQSKRMKTDPVRTKTKVDTTVPEPATKTGLGYEFTLPTPGNEKAEISKMLLEKKGQWDYEKTDRSRSLGGVKASLTLDDGSKLEVVTTFDSQSKKDGKLRVGATKLRSSIELVIVPPPGSTRLKSTFVVKDVKGTDFERDKFDATLEKLRSYLHDTLGLKDLRVR